MAPSTTLEAQEPTPSPKEQLEEKRFPGHGLSQAKESTKDVGIECEWGPWGESERVMDHREALLSGRSLPVTRNSQEPSTDNSKVSPGGQPVGL